LIVRRQVKGPGFGAYAAHKVHAAQED
jgi:hypothetical protein